jgi:ribosome biogenesis GTPase / thiamine phosphate phosphatase
VRASDHKGRHTTSRRELFALPSGGFLIDTPGTRELGLLLLDDDHAHPSGFPDVDALAARCRFSDCAHDQEPNCAVKDALTTGALLAARWASYRHQLGELRFLAEKSADTDHEKRARERRFGRMVKDVVARKERRGG